MNCRPGSKRKRKGIRTTTRRSRKLWKISKQIFNLTNVPSHNSNTKMPLFIAISSNPPLLSKNSNSKSPNSAGTNNKLKSSCESHKPNVISTPTKSTKKTNLKNNSKSNLMNSWLKSTGSHKKKDSKTKRTLPFWLKFKNSSTSSKTAAVSPVLPDFPFLRTSKWAKKNSSENEKPQISPSPKTLYSQSSKASKSKTPKTSWKLTLVRTTKAGLGKHPLPCLKNSIN